MDFGPVNLSLSRLSTPQWHSAMKWRWKRKCTSAHPFCASLRNCGVCVCVCVCRCTETSMHKDLAQRNLHILARKMQFKVLIKLHTGFAYRVWHSKWLLARAFAMQLNASNAFIYNNDAAEICESTFCHFFPKNSFGFQQLLSLLKLIFLQWSTRENKNDFHRTIIIR